MSGAVMEMPGLSDGAPSTIVSLARESHETPPLANGAAPASAGTTSVGPTSSSDDFYERELLALVEAYPLGSVVTFHTYHAAIWPRGWREVAQSAPWGLRHGDQLEVVNYGATRGFPEALVVLRVGDGVSALVFPSELASATATRVKLAEITEAIGTMESERASHLDIASPR